MKYGPSNETPRGKWRQK